MLTHAHARQIADSFDVPFDHRAVEHANRAAKRGRKTAEQYFRGYCQDIAAEMRADSQAAADAERRYYS